MRGFRNSTVAQLWTSKSFPVNYNIKCDDLQEDFRTIQGSIRCPPLEPIPEIPRKHFFLPNDLLSVHGEGEQRLSVAYCRCVSQQRIFGDGITRSFSGSTMVSCAFLVHSAMTNAWIIVQHYSDACTGPIGGRRCAAKLQRPVLVDNIPLVAFSFNQAIWLEEGSGPVRNTDEEGDESGENTAGPDAEVIVTTPSAGMPATQHDTADNQEGEAPPLTSTLRQNAHYRRVRIATFARSEFNHRQSVTSGAVGMRVSTIHVPQQTLKRACALEIIPDAASIVITTRIRPGETVYRVHEFRF